LNSSESDKYDIIDSGNWKTAGNLPVARRNFASTAGVVLDVLLLSETNFVIGTFSSQISRLSYELLQLNTFPGIPSGTTLMYDDWWYIGDTKLNSADSISENFVGLYLPKEQYEENNRKFEKFVKG